MIYGYARVHRDLTERRQIMAMLEQAGAEEILFDSHQIQARYLARSKLRRIADKATVGDIVVIPDISHLNRRIAGMLIEVDGFIRKGVRVRSLGDGWLDTGGEHGQFVREIVHSLVTHEQRQIELLNQWSKERFGREPSKRIAYPDAVVEQVVAMRKNGASYDEIRKETGMSRNTVIRYMRMDSEKQGGQDE